ncbi:inositol monophosphatase 1-like [Kryptolebias marmoratus]|uniref:Inositol-1-monophosphatase n=1 Tax=Kryptolebias marmoratus TaxID=37003 RepID=A0A3Q3B3X2_KRYMA|nr:inositol monophosphatase 1-like [Kryptolebias marmoratus]XP_017261802.1 inositol monophosphatase 1-like [Kryptolebias marmoratus]
MENNSEDSWQIAYDFAVEVAKKAGEEIRKAGESEIKIMTKSSTVDLVTKTDERVEKIIIGSLKEKFGEGTHCFIGEESVAKGEPCILTDKPTWIIDPVDGTTNFVHGFPFVAVSIAFAINKQLEFGVVYSCLEDKMYKARRGKGAFCNDEPIQVSDVKDIHKSIIISEHGTDRSPDKVNKIFSTMQKILCIPVHGLRGSGTAATNMCLVATGSVEAFFEIGIHCWDIAAGAVIVQEAGGILLDVDGGPFDLMSRRMVSANNDVIAKRIIKEIDVFTATRDDAPIPKK